MLTRRQTLKRAGALGLSTPIITRPLFAAVFADIEQAQRMLFPRSDHFTPVAIDIDNTRAVELARLAEVRIPQNFRPQVWLASHAGQPDGWVMSDRVVGKVDWIDFAVAFDSQGGVLGVEILAYRESHGSEIRQAAWRRQFVGRQGPGSMRFADDIRNISGATLSCQHLTEGVQRLSALVILLKRPVSR